MKFAPLFAVFITILVTSVISTPIRASDLSLWETDSEVSKGLHLPAHVHDNEHPRVKRNVVTDLITKVLAAGRIASTSSKIVSDGNILSHFKWAFDSIRSATQAKSIMKASSDQIAAAAKALRPNYTPDAKWGFIAAQDLTEIVGHPVFRGLLPEKIESTIQTAEKEHVQGNPAPLGYIWKEIYTPKAKSQFPDSYWSSSATNSDVGSSGSAHSSDGSMSEIDA